MHRKRALYRFDNGNGILQIEEDWCYTNYSCVIAIHGFYKLQSKVLFVKPQYLDWCHLLF